MARTATIIDARFRGGQVQKPIPPTMGSYKSAIATTSRIRLPQQHWKTKARIVDEDLGQPVRVPKRTTACTELMQKLAKSASG